MKNIGICPRCGGRSLAEWLDGDTSCWICGYVIYQRALIPVGTAVRDGRHLKTDGRRHAA
jgi:tRNA(Ile2) C34 agmatinyltransferase TiaS